MAAQTMACLPYSCTVLTTNSRPSSKPFSPKPSQLLTDSRRSHRFQVSCNGGINQNPSADGTVDRRNLLLGLGGLYGAANLVSDSQAYAAPIEPPEFKNCGVARDVQTNDILDVNCCPPVTDKIIDYKLPPVTNWRIRPAAHRVSKEYLAKFEEAIRRMKALDKDDPTDPRGFMQQANIHCAYCNGAHDQVGFKDLDLQVHNSWLFFPFHRWYLYFYERILGKLIDDPTFCLPFWNWDNPKGMQMPRIFDKTGSPLYNVNRDKTHRPPALIDLSLSNISDDLQVVVNNLTVMYSEMIRSVNSTLDFMGKPYRKGDNPSPGMGSSERGSHVAAHVWVGDPNNRYREDMGNFYSAGRDILFYSHHANVDRMWSIWRTLKTDVPKDITDPDYLNAAFLFYDENKQLVRVRVADCIDHKKMGYDFEKVDIPWLNYRPPKKAAKTKIQNISSGAQKAEGLFPLNLKKITRVLVPKSAKGKADEVLVLENIETDATQYIKFDVFVNDEDDNAKELDKAEYAGTFAQVPHKTKSKKDISNINLRLTELYEDIDIDDDDTIVVTLVPRSNGDDVTIGGIKIIPSPPKSA
ncbi:polyphenol oxidase I, chloroplastic-like [Sesamum indicum]|uniref:Polyphenol oxidase I, chloroplastic-like n=1 Tax=Sesamum indicum TaxID=4182 RepID=A0A6I9TD70_SESIN|nr:polyphenol oxidase I, chloroplastic-like [Sesamum indicum]